MTNILIFIILMQIFIMLFLWRFFKDQGQSPWKALIPIYNHFIVFRMVLPLWLSLTLIIVLNLINSSIYTIALIIILLFGFKSKINRNILIMLMAVQLIGLSALSTYKTATASMRPTIMPGDHIVVNRLKYNLKLPFGNIRLLSLSSPQKGDLVHFIYPRYVSPGLADEFIYWFSGKMIGEIQSSFNPRDFFKRVAACPGDVVTVSYGQLEVNGKKCSYQNKFNENDPFIRTFLDNNPEFNLNEKGRVISINKESIEFGIDESLSLEKEKCDNWEIYLLKRKTSNNNDIPAIYVPKKGDRIIISQKQNNSYELSVNNSKSFALKSSYLLWYQKIANIDDEKGKIDFICKDNYYFLMGDNRDNSSDSRDWGFVPEKNISSEVVDIYFPSNRYGALNK